MLPNNITFRVKFAVLHLIMAFYLDTGDSIIVTCQDMYEGGGGEYDVDEDEAENIHSLIVWVIEMANLEPDKYKGHFKVLDSKGNELSLEPWEKMAII